MMSLKQAVADGGAPNDPRNYEPKPRDQHIKEHMENGDFKRWGARSALPRGTNAASAVMVIPGLLDLREALQKYPDLPFATQFAILSGTVTLQDLEAADQYFPGEI